MTPIISSSTITSAISLISISCTPRPCNRQPARWSETAPRVQLSGRAIQFERWLENAGQPGGSGERVDVWSTYIFAVPGIFILQGARYPAGTAAACAGRKPVGIEPILQNIEQQAVTPITAQLTKRMGIVMAAFEEDRTMIEAQQKIWDLTSPEKAKLFLPQDKGPFLMRRLMEKLIKEEASSRSEPSDSSEAFDTAGTIEKFVSA